MEILEQLRASLAAGAWYPVAALSLMLLIQLLRRPEIRGYFWSRIPQGAKWLVPLVGAAVTGFVDAYVSGADLIQALGMAVFAVGLPASGAAAWLTDSPLPWNGGPGGK